MSKILSENNKTNPYLIKRALKSNIIASVLSSMITNICLTMDGIIAGNFVGANALVAIGFVTPIIGVIDSLINISIDGAVVLMPIDLGEDNINVLNRRMSVAIAFRYLLILITSISVIFLAKPLSLVLIEGEILIQKGFVDYIIVLLGFRIIIGPFTCMPKIFRCIGKNKESTIMLSIVSIGNVVFDLLFTAVLGMGVKGCAYGTVCGWLITIPYIVYVFKRVLILKIVNPINHIKTYCIENIVAGIPKSVTTGLNAILGITMNHITMMVAGATGMLVITVGTHVFTLASFVTTGLRKSMQSVAGYYCGMKDYESVYIIYKKVLSWIMFSLGCFILAIMIFPGKIFNVFGCYDIEVISYGKVAIRELILCLIPLNYVLLLIVIYQMEKRYKLAINCSAILTVSILLFYLFSYFVCRKLLWFSFLFASLFTLLVQLLLAYLIAKKDKNLLMPSLIPLHNDDNIFTKSISYIKSDIDTTISDVKDFFIKKGISQDKIDKIIKDINNVSNNILNHNNKNSKARYSLYIKVDSDLVASFMDANKKHNLIDELKDIIAPDEKKHLNIFGENVLQMKYKLDNNK